MKNLVEKITQTPWLTPKQTGAVTLKVKEGWNIDRYTTKVSSGFVADVYGDTREQAEANAVLIAASREMLTALMNITYQCEQRKHGVPLARLLNRIKDEADRINEKISDLIQG